MIDNIQINKWLEQGIITQEQANKMLLDNTEYKQEATAKKITVTISTIGTVSLGIGAILFMASNWEHIPNIIKLLIFIGSTFIAYWLGYYCKYQKQNFPKTGGSLIFLGAILFGATLCLIFQIYHVNASDDTLILLWLLGNLPFIYAFTSSPIAVLSIGLFYLWFFCYPNPGSYNNADFIKTPAILLISGASLFSIGAFHYLSGQLHKIARLYRLIGIKVVMVALFLLTFDFFSVAKKFNYPSTIAHTMLSISQRFSIGFICFVILTILATVILLFFNPTKSKTNSIENYIILGLTAIILIFFYFPATTSIYTIIFNFVLIGIALILLYVGYQKEDLNIVNIGMSWISIFILVRYFDFFWELLPRSLFFIVGGLILILGGLALERKHRELKEKFKDNCNITHIN